MAHECLALRIRLPLLRSSSPGRGEWSGGCGGLHRTLTGKWGALDCHHQSFLFPCVSHESMKYWEPFLHNRSLPQSMKNSNLE